MSRDLSFIYFGNDWFGENRTSAHHIARRLGQRFPLLYIETPGMRAPQASGRDLRKIFKKLAAALRGPRKIDVSMWYMSVPQVPYRRYRTIRKLNEHFARWKIKRALRKLSLDSPVSWFTVPHPGYLAGTLGEQLMVYYCVDNYSALPDVNASEVAAMDEELSRRADLIFAVSPVLTEAKLHQNETVIYSPHGVDAELFAQAADLSRPVASGVRDAKHPVIGFFGVVDSRIDIELIEFLAAQEPRWSFVFVGRVATDIGQLARMANVICVGAVPYETLPDWARSFDLCIMPYRLNAFSQNANPLKLREYLATGRPVVSVPMPEVGKYVPSVAIESDRQKFLEAMRNELATDSEDKRRARMQLVSGDTWDARVKKIIETVMDHLKQEDKTTT
jgi:glycosyltransferase involved in cell wall biosynthesis